LIRPDPSSWKKYTSYRGLSIDIKLICIGSGINYNPPNLVGTQNLLHTKLDFTSSSE